MGESSVDAHLATPFSSTEASHSVLTPEGRETEETHSLLGSYYRVSYAQFLSALAEQELAIDDALSSLQKELHELKQNISTQSKINYLLERDVRYLDGRIALLIQNRMQLDEVRSPQLDV
jgi:Ras GTPase-activating-like protein IQGAP2/3